VVFLGKSASPQHLEQILEYSLLVGVKCDEVEEAGDVEASPRLRTQARMMPSSQGWCETQLPYIPNVSIYTKFFKRVF